MSFLNKIAPRQMTGAGTQAQIAQIKSAGINTIGVSTQGLPKVVSNVVVRKKILNSTQVQLTVIFTQNPNDLYFKTAKVYLQLGTANPTVIGEGSASPLTVTVLRTHTPATVIVASTGNWGSTNVASSPAQSVSLA